MIKGIVSRVVVERAFDLDLKRASQLQLRLCSMYSSGDSSGDLSRKFQMQCVMSFTFLLQFLPISHVGFGAALRGRSTSLWRRGEERLEIASGVGFNDHCDGTGIQDIRGRYLETAFGLVVSMSKYSVRLTSIGAARTTVESAREKSSATDLKCMVVQGVRVA